MSQTVSRREVLKAGAGLTFVISLPIAGCATTSTPANEFKTAWVTVRPDNSISIVSPAAEMGQGSLTALPVIFGEEFDVDWDRVTVHSSDSDDSLYANPISWIHGIMLTLGSSSVAGYYDHIRLLGAQARRVMVEIAARTWDVPMQELTTEPSVVVHQRTSRQISYGELAQIGTASTELPSVSESDLKSVADFRLIGHDVPRRDVPSKTDGSAEYSIDVRLPDMRYASVVRAPTKGGRAIEVRRHGHDDSQNVTVVHLPDSVAYVSDNFYSALEAERSSTVLWDNDDSQPKIDSTIELQKHLEIVGDLSKGGQSIQQVGQLEANVNANDRSLRRTYSTDLVYHAHLEPLNSVARTNADGSLDIWAGTQAPTHLIRSVAKALDISTDAVTLHRSLLGGAFGRRGAQDHDWAIDAALLSQELGVPVKAIWSRESDVRYGRFKAITAHRIEATINDQARITNWHHRLASDEALEQSDPYRYEKTGQWPVISTVGLSSPYTIPNIHTEFVRTHTGMRLSPLRGVGGTANIFASESFIDELAHEGGIDPVEFRLRHLNDSIEGQNVIQAVAEASNWSAGSGLGIAYADMDGTVFATVVRLAETSTRAAPVIEKVWAAVDAGIAVQPDNIRNQFEGAIIYGLSNALRERITIADGKVQQSNFHDYLVMRMRDVPEIDVQIQTSNRSPGGIGDTVGVTVAPAVANAIWSMSGSRVTALPFHSTG